MIRISFSAVISLNFSLRCYENSQIKNHICHFAVPISASFQRSF